MGATEQGQMMWRAVSSADADLLRVALGMGAAREDHLDACLELAARGAPKGSADVGALIGLMEDLVAHGAKARGGLVAVAAGHDESAEALALAWVLRLDGVDIHHLDSSGRNAMFDAVSGRGGKKTIERLVQAGLDVDLEDKYGWTPLSLAVHPDGKEVFEALIRSGASVEWRDAKGRDPFRKARDQGFIDAFQEEAWRNWALAIHEEWALEKAAGPAVSDASSRPRL